MYHPELLINHKNPDLNIPAPFLRPGITSGLPVTCNRQRRRASAPSISWNFLENNSFSDSSSSSHSITKGKPISRSGNLTSLNPITTSILQNANLPSSVVNSGSVHPSQSANNSVVTGINKSKIIRHQPYTTHLHPLTNSNCIDTMSSKPTLHFSKAHPCIQKLSTNVEDAYSSYNGIITSANATQNSLNLYPLNRPIVNFNLPKKLTTVIETRLVENIENRLVDNFLGNYDFSFK